MAQSRSIPQDRLASLLLSLLEKKAGKALHWSYHYMNNHITKSSREAAAAETGEPVFADPNSKRVLDDYIKGMTEKYGSDPESHPLGDLEVWGQVAKRPNRTSFLGVGGASDAAFMVTGQSSTGRSSSSIPLDVASSNEVHLLKEQSQEAKAREDALRKEIEELRKRDEEREAEFCKREEA